MKIRVWIAIINCGDGSSTTRLFPTEAELRTTLSLDDEDFEIDEDGNSSECPVEIEARTIETNNFLMVEQ